MGTELTAVYDALGAITSVMTRSGMGIKLTAVYDGLGAITSSYRVTVAIVLRALMATVLVIKTGRLALGILPAETSSREHKSIKHQLRNR